MAVVFIGYMGLDQAQIDRERSLRAVMPSFRPFEIHQSIANGYKAVYETASKARNLRNSNVLLSRNYYRVARAIHRKCNGSLENLLAAFFRKSHRRFMKRFSQIPLEVGSLVQRHRIEDGIIAIMCYCNDHPLIDFAEACILYERVEVLLANLEQTTESQKSTAA